MRQPDTDVRPLSPLDRPVQFLKGVGPKRAELLARLGISNARDLLYHIPRRYLGSSDVTNSPSFYQANLGDDFTAVGKVLTTGVVPTRTGLRIFQAVIEDEKDKARITCSWPGQPWVGRYLKGGDRILVTGPVKYFHGRQLQPKEYEILSRPGGSETEDEANVREGGIFPVYPATEGLSQWFFRKAIDRNLDWLLEQLEEEEYLTPKNLTALGLMHLTDALETLHHPESKSDADEARKRLAFDEAFFIQILHARHRYRLTVERPGIAFKRTNEYIVPLLKALPFTLTDAQIRALGDKRKHRGNKPKAPRGIYDDMISTQRMNRMLQGDVGSGKTLVALFAMLLAVESGYQAALMAPTEILAEQHSKTIRRFLKEIPVTVETLVGSAKGRIRKEARARIASGQAKLVVGTHALIQEGVDFAALGLVVVDEQHRFGVRQRMALAERKPTPDLLVMSATPIPRSLAMTLHGDLDLSIIDELPKGRQPIKTRLAEPKEREDIYREVAERIAQGQQVYFVYPLIEESDKLKVLSAEKEFARLQRGPLAGFHLALLHGKLPALEKEEIMRDFLKGEIDVLVATTVIEVGIDVPNATMMVVENAERFGLSQLHQLRGRIGRGHEESLCVLVSDPKSGSGERLRVMSRTQDGFKIARADLRIRGPGDIFGAEQHGRIPNLRFADELMENQYLVAEAQTRARHMVDDDPELASAGSAHIMLQLGNRLGDIPKLPTY